nr:MAG TPA: hypothetical protein [Inoviridae sp.]
MRCVRVAAAVSCMGWGLVPRGPIRNRVAATRTPAH